MIDGKEAVYGQGHIEQWHAVMDNRLPETQDDRDLAGYNLLRPADAGTY